MRLTHEILPLRTKHPFIIARGGSDEYPTVLVTLTDSDGVEGLGEAAPSSYYGETPETVIAALAKYTPVLKDADAFAIEDTEAALLVALRGNPSARAAISGALHDLVGKRLGVPVWKMWGLNPEKAPRSSFTIGIAATDELRKRVGEARQYPILKVKLGTDRDEEIIRTVRDAAPDKILRVDANTAWTPKRALKIIPLLAELGVEFVEQPLPAHDLRGLKFVRDRSQLPIVADESCLVASDVSRLAGIVDGINLKLAKCGSLLEARRIIHTARANQMRVMCGCMIESSLSISAAAQFAPLLDDADLDGAALVANDPFDGVTIARGVIALSDKPGLGVTRRAG
ncbi:MAG TPA: dipeptide epimerase [Gemmatimonadaceae bacterium]|nr:dipeptide epimerase [Gemmatimonadaceae bacterium]